MEAQELRRGRLVDHIQLVVRDLPASQKFYSAVLEVLGVPIGGKGDDYFWADELFVSTPDSVLEMRTEAALRLASPWNTASMLLPSGSF